MMTNILTNQSPLLKGKMRNTIKVILAIASVALLAACGGGGGGGTPITTEETKRNAVLLTKLSNERGVARVTGGGTVGFLYFPEITTVVEGFNSDSSSDNSSGISNLNPTSFPIISSTATTQTRRGTLTVDDLSLNVTVVKNNLTDNAFGVYLEIPNDADAYMILGDVLTQTPTSGNGSFVGAFTQNSRSVIAPGQMGSFNLNVNYSQKTFTINASTDSASLIGNGVVDLTSGLFASTSVILL